jgi:cobalt-zinc-cadmium resistance protein CzcA
MLNWLITLSLRQRLAVLVVTLAFVVVGFFSLSRLDIDAFPDTTPVQVQINTVAPALSPEEVEQQITFPVEQAISGLPDLEQVRSISKFGLSQVVVVFADGTNIYFARQLIMERLSTVELPEGLPRPEMGPVSTGLGEVFHYVVKGKGKDLTELRTVQDWILRPALRTVPGTAEVNSWGGFEKRYEVRIDPTLLKKHGLTFSEVVDAVAANNLNVGGGNIQSNGAMQLLHGVGRVTNAAELRQIIVAAHEGVALRVGDVAEVGIGHEIRRGAVTAQGQGESVLGLGFMLMGENSHEVTHALKTKLDDLKRTLPPGVQVETVYDRTELVDYVIATVRKNLFEGGLFVIAVLFVFLGNLRAGIIVALAIPLSMLFAFAGMLRFGIAGSLLSLGALDFGLVVDSSVIMVENVVRRLSHRKEGEAHLSHAELVKDAAIEVRKPTMFGELIIMMVYLPILTLEGVEGKLFRPMALTVIFALVGSLVLSLTLMPVLASLLLPKRMEEKDPWVVRLARRLYEPVLRLALRFRAVVVALAVAVLVFTVMLARGLGSEFIPRLSEGAIVLNVVRLAGTDLSESVRYNTRMEKALLAAFPDEIRHVWSRIGSAEVATDPMGVELTDVFVSLTERSRWRKATTQAELVELMQKEIRDLPGQNVAFTQPIEMRMNEMISGVRSDVAVKLFGDDFDVLVAKGREIEAALRSVQGCADPSTEQITGQPVLEIRVDQDQIARYGIPARDVLDLVESVGGKPIGEVIEGQLRFPLVARLPEAASASAETLGAIELTTPRGERIPLSRLAAVRGVEGPSTITREWGQRRITLQCNVRGRDVGSFIAEAQPKVAAIQFPAGRYRVEWGGQFENMERARTRLLIVVPVVLVLICGLLYLSFRSMRLALLVFTGVPLAVTGGVVALWLRGMPLSISAAVGFIALSGVAVLNGLVMVTFIRQLRVAGLPLEEAVLEGSLVRLRPVLMTALVAALGFVPMAVATGMGAEVQKPLATVVIGGIVSSCLLTLVVLPVLYRWFDPPVEPSPTTLSNEVP